MAPFEMRDRLQQHRPQAEVDRQVVVFQERATPATRFPGGLLYNVLRRHAPPQHRIQVPFGKPQQTLPVVLEGLRQLLACAISGRVFHDFEVSRFRGFEVW